MVHLDRPRNSAEFCRTRFRFARLRARLIERGPNSVDFEPNSASSRQRRSRVQNHPVTAEALFCRRAAGVDRVRRERGRTRGARTFDAHTSDDILCDHWLPIGPLPIVRSPSRSQRRRRSNHIWRRLVQHPRCRHRSIGAFICQSHDVSVMHRLSSYRAKACASLMHPHSGKQLFRDRAIATTW